MTIPEAEEHLESLSLQLRNCHDPVRRARIKTKMRSCQRSIQITRQQSRDALAGLADLLPEGQDQALIRLANIEQLAIALAYAVRDWEEPGLIRVMALHLRTSRG